MKIYRAFFITLDEDINPEDKNYLVREDQLDDFFEANKSLILGRFPSLESARELLNNIDTFSVRNDHWFLSMSRLECWNE